MYAAKNIFFIVTGSSKCDVLKKVFSGQDKELPVARIMNEYKGNLVWFFDAEARKGVDEGLELKRKL